ncbi:hypothetical protein CLOM_g5942 [Closterium sp. NIES-68]|nr:hypothetical protein CLOM_g5942 [Closterium sp. NIES-68]GJP46683.1 hypothetical protein CLOM_g5942 [Closterium sp. NIES-68]
MADSRGPRVADADVDMVDDVQADQPNLQGDADMSLSDGHDPEIIKSEEDKKAYRMVTLPNGLITLLIYDPEIAASGDDEDDDEEEEEDEEIESEESDEEMSVAEEAGDSGGSKSSKKGKGGKGTEGGKAKGRKGASKGGKGGDDNEGEDSDWETASEEEEGEGEDGGFEGKEGEKAKVADTRGKEGKEGAAGVEKTGGEGKATGKRKKVGGIRLGGGGAGRKGKVGEKSGAKGAVGGEGDEEVEEGSEEEMESGEEEEYDDEDEEGDSDEEDEEDDEDDDDQPGAAKKLAAAAMCVGVGSFLDPPDALGLAHFLEHMLFMGSVKFPDENEYDSFLRRHGGGSNAFTETEFTCYHFDVAHKYLHPALDRFAQFFVAPLAKAEAMEREVQAVDSEFNISLQSDVCRVQQLQCFTCAQPDHPFHKFSWGNRKSLIDDPAALGVDMRERLLQLYSRFYTAGAMRLVVVGGEPLDTLESWVRQLFSPIPPGGSGIHPLVHQLPPPVTFSARSQDSEMLGPDQEDAGKGEVVGGGCDGSAAVAGGNGAAAAGGGAVGGRKGLLAAVLAGSRAASEVSTAATAAGGAGKGSEARRKGTAGGMQVGKTGRSAEKWGGGSAGGEEGERGERAGVAEGGDGGQWRGVWEGGRLYEVASVKEQQQVSLMWSLPCLHGEYESKPHDYISHLIGHEGSGSLLSLLKGKGWATELAAGVGESGYEKSSLAFVFTVTVTLSDDGLKHALDVVGTVFQYITMLRQAPPQHWVFEELQAIAVMDLRFAEEESPDEYAVRLAGNMFYYPKRHVIAGDYIHDKWDPDRIAYLLSLLSPHSVRLDLLTHSFDHSREEQGRHSQGALVWRALHHHPGACVPAGPMGKRHVAEPRPVHAPRNEFIPTDFSLRPSKTTTTAAAPTAATTAAATAAAASTAPLALDTAPVTAATTTAAATTSAPVLGSSPGGDTCAVSSSQPLNGSAPSVPRVVLEDGRCKVWHKQDDVFLTPRLNAHFALSSPSACDSARSAALTELAVKLIEDSLNETLYLASVAKLDTVMSVQGFKIEVRITGFSHKLPALAARIFRHISTFQAAADRFSALKEERCRAYRNALLKPLKHSAYLRLLLLRTPAWTIPDKLSALSACEVEDLNAFLKSLFSRVHMEVLIHGNATEADALSLAAAVTDTLPVPAPPLLEIPAEHCLQLPRGASLLVESPVGNPAEENSAVEVYYQACQDLGRASIRDRSLVDLLEQVMSEPLFDTLRTKEQLGYRVDCGTRLTHGVFGFCIRVQSAEYGPDYLQGRVDSFLKTFRDNLSALPETDFRAHRAALQVLKMRKDHTLGDETHRYWEQIWEGSSLFNSRQLEAVALCNITLAELCAWFDRHVSMTPVSDDVDSFTEGPAVENGGGNGEAGGEAGNGEANEGDGRGKVHARRALVHVWGQGSGRREGRRAARKGRRRMLGRLRRVGRRVARMARRLLLPLVRMVGGGKGRWWWRWGI